MNGYNNIARPNLNIAPPLPMPPFTSMPYPPPPPVNFNWNQQGPGPPFGGMRPQSEPTHFGGPWQNNPHAPQHMSWGPFGPRPFGLPPQVEFQPENYYQQQPSPHRGQIFPRQQQNWPPNLKIHSRRFPPLPHTPAETQTQIDQKWIKNFIQNCDGKQNKTSETSKQTTQIKISEARQLHSKAYQLMKDIEGIRSKIDNHANSEFLKELNILKRELDKILSKLSNEETILHICSDVEKRKKKRKRNKEKRIVSNEENRNVKEKINVKNSELDKWLRKQDVLEKKQKRENEVQKQLDKCLQDVRLKQTQLQKSLELFSSLAKLRKVRKDSATQRGLQPLDVNDEILSKAHDSACKLLNLRLKTCKEEELSLRQFLAEEERMQEERKRRKELKEEEEKHNQWNSARWQVLFGPIDEKDAFDPLWPIQELHKQASSTLPSLTNTRQRWDQFGVVDSSDGTRIPLRWIEPVPPSSDAWKEYCDLVL